MGGDVAKAVAEAYRAEQARLLGMVTRVLGVGRIGDAENIVQESFARALATWPAEGVPARPGAWLNTVARRLALDFVRGPAGRTDAWGEDAEPAAPEDEDAFEFAAFRDDELRVLFLGCHPSLPPESQLVLTLRLACGLTVAEIAKGLLTKEATVAQRLTRAKAALKDAGAAIALPGPDELPARRQGVLRAIYALFNEGYAATEATALVRHDLCREAIRLLRVLAADHRTATPDAFALSALAKLQGSRLPARCGPDGGLLLLAAQDRSLWDRALMAEGFADLTRAMDGTTLTTYHLEAGIAALHASAPSFAATDWAGVVALYDQLYAMTLSPVVGLNRAVALLHRSGEEAAWEALAPLRDNAYMKRYYLLPAVEGEILARLGRTAEARAAYAAAMALCRNGTEIDFLRGKLAGMKG